MRKSSFQKTALKRLATTLTNRMIRKGLPEKVDFIDTFRGSLLGYSSLFCGGLSFLEKKSKI